MNPETAHGRWSCALIALVSTAGLAVGGPPVLPLEASLDGLRTEASDGYGSTLDRAGVFVSDGWSADEAPAALRDVCARVWFDVSGRPPASDTAVAGGGMPATAAGPGARDAATLCLSRSCRARMDGAYVYCIPDARPGDDCVDLIESFAEADSVSGRLLSRISSKATGPPIDVYLEWAALTRVGSGSDR